MHAMKQTSRAVAFLVLLAVVYVSSYFAPVTPYPRADGSLYPYYLPVEIEDDETASYRFIVAVYGVMQAAFQPMHDFDSNVLRRRYWGNER